MSLPFLHYDVFTREPLTGNQLAVFLDARSLTVNQMQAIACEMNFSETTFVLPAEVRGTDVRMRIFTPGLELAMAGHPTIGSAFALADAGLIAPGTQRFVFGLGIGPTPVDLEWEDNRLRFVWMTQSIPEFGRTVSNRQSVAAAIGLSNAELAPDLPVQQVSCGLPYFMVPLRDRAAVDRAVSDSGAARRFAASEGIDDALFLFAVLPADDPLVDRGFDATVYSRMFAPQLGIVEDAATGSASGPLGCYLVKHSVVAGVPTARILSLQGVAMLRPSRIQIQIAIDGRTDTISTVKVGGEAILIARGELLQMGSGVIQ